MKKLLALLLTVIMVFSLVACGEKDDSKQGEDIPAATQSGDQGGENQGTENDGDGNNNESNENVGENADPAEKMLSRAGLKPDEVKPAEETFDIRFDEGDDEFTFYMEKNIEQNTAAYMHKIQDACKAASDDGKLYKADFNFFMGTNLTEYPPLPSDDDMNDGMMYIMQFGYLYNGRTITVTAARVMDMHPNRDDDIYYPIYTLSLGF